MEVQVFPYLGHIFTKLQGRVTSFPSKGGLHWVAYATMEDIALWSIHLGLFDVKHSFV